MKTNNIPRERHCCGVRKSHAPLIEDLVIILLQTNENWAIVVKTSFSRNDNRSIEKLCNINYFQAIFEGIVQSLSHSAACKVDISSHSIRNLLHQDLHPGVETRCPNLLFLAPLPRATIAAKLKQEQEAFIYHIRAKSIRSSNISTVKLLHMSAKHQYCRTLSAKHQYCRTLNLPYLRARCELESTQKIKRNLTRLSPGICTFHLICLDFQHNVRQMPSPKAAMKVTVPIPLIKSQTFLRELQ